MALHESLGPAERTGTASDIKGRWIAVADRTGSHYPWTVTVDVGDVDSGSITARFEASQRRDDNALIVLHTFAAAAVPVQRQALVTLSGYLARGWVRTVGSVTGRATFGSREEAAFFSRDAEPSRLSPAVAKWDHVEAEIARAENDLLTPHRAAYGDYALRMDAPAFASDLRDAIATQVEHRFQLWALGKSADPAAKVSLRGMASVDRSARFRVGAYGPVVHF